MNDLDFYASVVATGTVLGLDETSDTGDLAERLGYDREEGETQRAHPFRLLGFVESAFTRTRDRGWQGVGLTVRVRDLHYGDVVPPALSGLYGSFGNTVPFPELRDVLESRGFPLEEIPTGQEDWRRFRQPDSHAGIWVYDGDPDPDVPPRPGDVQSIRIPETAPGVPRGRSLHDATAAVRRLSPEERLRWLAKRQPAAGPERVEWWEELLSAASARLHGVSAQRLDWARFALWTLRQAESAHPFSPMRMACWKAGIAGTVHELGLRDDVPSADEVIGDCLAAISMKLPDAAPPEFASPEPSAIRRRREMKNLVDVALPHLPRATAGVADELREWFALRITPLPAPGGHRRS